MSEKFMNRLGLMNWYIITLFYKSDGNNEIASGYKIMNGKKMVVK